MKKIQNIFITALALGLVACSDGWMTTEPEGATKTADQKAKAEQQNPAAAEGSVNAMYAQMIQLYAGLSDMGYELDYDFGYPFICMMTDCNGMDFIGQDIGYNWFWNCQYPNNRDNSGSSLGLFDHAMWNTYYKMIYTANNVIGGVDAANPGAMEVALCQAYCVRAFSYFQLAQMYQFNYVGNEDKLCVPIVLPNMPSDKQLNNPRATVGQVYDLIYQDLDYACQSEAFGEYKRSDNGHCNQAVAYGIRARVNLVTQNMSEAKADAEECLKLSGAYPLSIAECQTPGFADAAQHNVIWANIIVETNDVVKTSIINYPSHLSSFYADGYTAVGAYRSISSELYSKINSTDVRKGWWLNGNNESPLLNVGGYAAVKEDIQGAGIPFINVKFGTADGTTTGTAACASDWIIMRAEEMELIIAECSADGGAYLKQFINTYRDPQYVVNGDLTEAVWIQRRIELWGEGFALQDLLRLQKGVTRSASTNWPASWMQDVPYTSLIWKIPEAEIEANQGIDAY